MSNKILKPDDCKVGDKIIYTDVFLKKNPEYLRYIIEHNVVYCIVSQIELSFLRTDWINHKGLIEMSDITNSLIRIDSFDISYITFEFYNSESPKDFKNILKDE